jgi:hypothetical protein
LNRISSTGRGTYCFTYCFRIERLIDVVSSGRYLMLSVIRSGISHSGKVLNLRFIRTYF